MTDADTPEEWHRDGCTIATDPARLDRTMIVDFLAGSYWAAGLSRAALLASIDNAFVFGLYDNATGAQVGYARVVTDFTRIAWLSDVFVLDSHRGRGLGHWLVETVTGHPRLGSVHRFLLATADQQGLYAKFGFERLATPAHFMVKVTG